jgi:preprotein translocase SecE subunit
LNRENEVATALGKITVSDDDVIESEVVEETADTPSSPPPTKTKAGTAGGDGDRRPRKTVATPGLFARIRQFLHDTRAEMRRVSWPGANLVKNTTLITLVAVVFFALYLFGVDRVWAFLIDHLRGWLGG